MYKLKNILPHPYYSILQSYLTNRTFRVRYLDANSLTFPINFGVPQGSVLGPLIFPVYSRSAVITAIFADNTALLSAREDPQIAFTSLQQSLDTLEEWFHKWRFKVNENKSTHITFFLRRQNCPLVTYNNSIIPTKDIWDCTSTEE